jgi:hypothetical protein
MEDKLSHYAVMTEDRELDKIRSGMDYVNLNIPRLMMEPNQNFLAHLNSTPSSRAPSCSRHRCSIHNRRRGRSRRKTNFNTRLDACELWAEFSRLARGICASLLHPHRHNLESGRGRTDRLNQRICRAHDLWAGLPRLALGICASFLQWYNRKTGGCTWHEDGANRSCEVGLSNLDSNMRMK